MDVFTAMMNYELHMEYVKDYQENIFQKVRPPPQYSLKYFSSRAYYELLHAYAIQAHSNLIGFASI